MGSITIVGIDNYISDLQALEKDLKGPVGRSIYEGAKIIADAVRSGIESAPARTGGKKTGLARGVTSVERQGLLDGLGISKARTDGGARNVHIGFDGYNSVKKPNAMVARSFEAGTSWLQKDAFITRAARSAQGSAEAKMQQIFESEIKKRGV